MNDDKSIGLDVHEATVCATILSQCGLVKTKEPIRGQPISVPLPYLRRSCR
jgi:hypothetical protein